MTTIPVPTYLLDLGQLKDLRAQVRDFLRTTGECDRALACIAATNTEIEKRTWMRPSMVRDRPHSPPKLRLVT